MQRPAGGIVEPAELAIGIDLEKRRLAVAAEKIEPALL
jgi:hypothetical protein